MPAPFLTEGNPYEVLGLSKFSSPEAVRKAYRTLAASTHPDRGGNADEFTRIAQAYDALSDPATRTLVDARLRTPAGPTIDPEIRARADAARARFRQGANQWARESTGGIAPRGRPRWMDPVSEADATARVGALLSVLVVHGLLDAAGATAALGHVQAAPSMGLSCLAEALAVILGSALAADNDEDRRSLATAAVYATSVAAGVRGATGVEAERKAVEYQIFRQGGMLASKAQAITEMWAPVAALLPPPLRSEWWAAQAAAVHAGRRW